MLSSVRKKNNLTAQEAYTIIHKKYPTERVRTCLEYDDFYVFVMAPLYVNDDDNYMPGTVFDAINKRSGQIFQYDISEDIDAYERAVEVEIDTVYNKTIEDIRI